MLFLYFSQVLSQPDFYSRRDSGENLLQNNFLLPVDTTVYICYNNR